MPNRPSLIQQPILDFPQFSKGSFVHLTDRKTEKHRHHPRSLFDLSFVESFPWLVKLNRQYLSDHLLRDKLGCYHDSGRAIL